MLEYWNAGMLEYWDVGPGGIVLRKSAKRNSTPMKWPSGFIGQAG